ncbi:MAG: hypothetical protein ACFCGT_18370 [Sandaracinaceae bacterium]
MGDMSGEAAPTKSRLPLFLGIGCGLLSLCCLSGVAGVYFVVPGVASGGPLGGGTSAVCERAVSCCEAYVGAMAEDLPSLDAEQQCGAVRAMVDTPGSNAACQNAIDGWRASLDAYSQEVPASCAPNEAD